MRLDSAVHTADPTDLPTHAVVLIRKHFEGGIINGWLVLITALAGLISVADGLTRSAIDWDLALLQPLGYEPNHAAVLLAVVTLPLTFAYAKKARVSPAEGLFLWFTFCTAAYMKDFSYLRLPGAPFFVTDAVLVVILLSIYLLPRRYCLHTPLALHLFLAFFVAAGMLAALRGFWGRGEPVLVLRDSALVAYALFLLVGYHLFRSWRSIKRFAVWFLLGTAMSVLSGLAWFVIAPEQRRFIFPGIYVLVSLIIVLVLLSNRIVRPYVGWVLAGVFSLGLLLANARSLFVSMAIVFAVVLVVPRFLRKKFRLVSLVATLILASGVSSSLAFVFLHQRAGQDFTIRVADELASGVFHSGDDPYWQFRLSAWKEAWKRFEEYPPAGEGFGIPFVFGIWDNDARPHNTFLTVLYKMGLIGFIPVVALLCYFFWCASIGLLHHRKKRHTLFLQVAFAVQICLCLYGMANFVLESPHLASLFWTAMGAELRMIRMLNLEGSLRKRASTSNVNSALPELRVAEQEVEDLA